ncbi:MAG: hypothetical protein Q9207_004060 [Kuettlingeria erythrocarpa]
MIMSAVSFYLVSQMVTASSDDETFYSALSTHSTISNAPSPQIDIGQQSDSQSAIGYLLSPTFEYSSDQLGIHQLNPDYAPAAAARTLSPVHGNQYIRQFASSSCESTEVALQSASTKLDQGSFSLTSGSPETRLHTYIEAAQAAVQPPDNGLFVPPVTPSPESHASNDLSPLSNGLSFPPAAPSSESGSNGFAEPIQQSASIRLGSDACSKRPSFSANSIAPQQLPHPTIFTQPDANAVSLVAGPPVASGNATALATTSRLNVHFVYATYFQRLENLKDIVHNQRRNPLVLLLNHIGNVKIFRDKIRHEWKQSIAGTHQYQKQKTQNWCTRQFTRGYRRILITTTELFVSDPSISRASHLVFLRLPRSAQDFHAAIERVRRTAAVTVYYDPDSWMEDQLMR